MPFSQKARSHLSEQFAEIFQSTQEDYRLLLSALRDERVDLKEFTQHVESLRDRLLKLKRIHEQLVRERDELRRAQAESIRIEAVTSTEMSSSGSGVLAREDTSSRFELDDPAREPREPRRARDEARREGDRPRAS